MNKEDVVYMEYYLAIKKNEILPFATTWLELQCIMLCEMSARERQMSYDFTYMWKLRYKKMNIGNGSKDNIKTEREATHKKL